MSGRWSAFVRTGCVAWSIAAFVAIMGSGCGSDDDDVLPKDPDDSRNDGVGSPCSTGAVSSCVSRNGGCTGTQVCGPDNLLGSCICDVVKPDAALQDASTLDAGVTPPDASDTTDAGTPDAGARDSGVPQKEICDNSKDDDEDGDIDCADADCGVRMCAPKAPTGWTGPTVHYVGDDPPDCTGTYPDEVAQGGTVAAAAAADCSTCSCAEASIACASVLDFVSGAEAACGGVSCTSSVSTSCTELSCPYLGASSGYVGSALPANLAQCTPSAQEPEVADDADWQDRMVACAPDAALRQGGCAEGEVCAPKTPFEGEICIVKEGDHTCPAGQFSQRHLYFTRIEDTRACSDCACDHDCAYKWQIFAAADTTCAGAPASELIADDQCVAVIPSASKLPVRAQVAGTGACSASGGDPTGSVSGKNAITVCCVD